jgi:hypothetical protein
MKRFFIHFQIAVIFAFHPNVARAQVIGHGVAIPYLSFLYPFTNRANLSPNYPMLGLDPTEGLVLWVWKPAPTNWVIESSTDLAAWRTDRLFYNNYLNADPVTLRAGGGAVAAPGENRFFRARVSSDLPGNAVKRWKQAGIIDYTFDYSYTCFCRDGSLRGTVTVRDGNVLSVTNAVHFVVTGPPDPVPPASSLFPSITELLVTQRPYFHVINLDPVYGYPRDIALGNPERDAGATIMVTNFRPNQ